MRFVLAANFPPGDLKRAQSAINKAGERGIELIEPDNVSGSAPKPGLALIYWGRGFKAFARKCARDSIPFIAVFNKPEKKAYKEARSLGAADCLPLEELSFGKLEKAMGSGGAEVAAADEPIADFNKFRAFLDNAPAITFIKDAQGRYRYVNALWEEISGKNSAEVLGKTTGELWPSETAQRMQVDDRSVLESGQIRKVLEWVPVKGERRFVVTHKFPIPDETGRLAMVAGMSTDVTEIEKAKEEKERSERKFRGLFDSANDGILIIDPDTLKILDANAVFAAMLGYSLDEITGMSLSHFNKDVDYASDANLARLRMGDPALFERIYARKDGSTFPVEIHSKMVELAGKRVFLGFVRDVTARKDHERKLAESELKYKTVIESAHDAIFLADAETGVLLDANSMAEKLTGYSRKELIGAHQSMLHPPEEKGEKYRGGFKSAVETGKGPPGYVFVQRKDGARIPVEIGVSLAEFGGHKIIVGIFRDVTGRLKAENEIRRKNELTRLLKDISVEANEAGAAESAMMTAISKIRDFTGWDLGHVYIVGQDNLIRSTGLISYDDGELARKFRKLTEAFIFEPGEGLPGRVCETCQPVWSRDMAAQSICLRDRSMVAIGLRAAFAFPVLEGRKTAAVLEFFARGMEEPDETMLDAIKGLAIQLGRVTERKKIGEKLQLAQKIIESAKEGIVITDAEANIQSVNRAFVDLTGYAPEEVIGKNPRLLKSGKHDKRFYAQMWEALTHNGSWEGEIWNRRKDGRAYPELLSITAIKDDHGETVKYAAIFNDISEYVSSKKEIEYQAYHDALTGLPNRLLLLDRLKHSMARLGREGNKMAVMFLDLDNFKNINDSLGHVTGDLLLKGASVRLVGCLREGDTVSRFGGDEFCLLVEDIKSDFEAVEIAQRVLAELAEPYLFEKQELVCTASIGVSIFPTDAQSADDLLKKADMAMYHAKEMGRSNFQFFTASLNEQYAKRLEQENNLRRAVAERGMVAYYQPKVSLKTGEISGMEALVRWRRADGEAVSSFDFIKIAEEIGLIYELDRWMMKTAMEFAARLNKKAAALGMTAKNVSINLSAKDLDRPEIVDFITQTAAEAGVPPHHVDLEITESAIIMNLDKVEGILSRLMEAGFNIALDDFGVGYSSMNYIRRLPINIIKMDRSFVMDLEPDPDSRLVAQSIISLAHGLGMKVVAEGVETEYQLNFLRDSGCDEMQGFLFSKAVAPEAFEKMVEANARLGI